MSNYLYFTNNNATFSIMADAAPKDYREFSTPIFCDLDSENLRFIIDYWRNNCTLTCKEQQLYDLVRLKMDHFDSKQTLIQVTVGHRTFSTTEASLTKLPYFEAAIRNKQDFKVNIDRDSVLFERLLSYCRHPLQHPLHKVDVSTEDFAFYGLCPKYLRLWNDEKLAQKEPGKITEQTIEQYRDYNTMSNALHQNPHVTLFMQTFYRITPYVRKTVFLEESEREENKECGDTVYFSSESIDCSFIDIVSNFYIICESDVEITSAEQVFANLCSTFYANNRDDKRQKTTFRKELVKRPVQSRHATIFRGVKTYVPEHEKLYVGKQTECRYDFHDDLSFVSSSNKIDPYQSNGDEVTVSTSASLQQCLWEFNEMLPLVVQKRGNKYYVTIPLHTFFSLGPRQSSHFHTLRNRFHFQLRFDGVKIKNVRLMVNTFQLSEEEHEAIVEREIELLTIVQYKVFKETTETGIFKKTWLANYPYSIRYFMMQVRDADSGERVVCNLKGKITIGEQFDMFNIHTNQAAQAEVMQMQKYNPYLWIVPFCMQKGSSQPNGCLFVLTDAEMSVEIECDLENVEIECWMSCYRVFGQNFANAQTPSPGNRNSIGFLCDQNIKDTDTKEMIKSNRFVIPAKKINLCRSNTRQSEIIDFGQEEEDEVDQVDQRPKNNLKTRSC